MREDRAVQGLAALGNRTRLRLFRVLVRAGNGGLNVGDLQRLLGIPGSTLSHHLATLARAGLVVQDRHGREVVTRADYAAMRGLIGYLTEACCTGVRLEDTDAGNMGPGNMGPGNMGPGDMGRGPGGPDDNGHAV